MECTTWPEVAQLAISCVTLVAVIGLIVWGIVHDDWR